MAALVRRACAAAAALAAAASAQSLVINTTYGQVKGTTDQGCRVWHSIPFAAPPVESLRFSPPHPPAPWAGVKDVTSLPPACPQVKIFAGLLVGQEDCLYLSVFVPENAGPGPLPVMSWIFGGAFILGDDWEVGLYDGFNLAKRTGAIVVTSNYRLGPLGFMATQELMSEDGTAGNAALLDQTAAMQWVHDNIAAFGGDPTRVTIFGESAGAFSVAWHVVSPASSGLFQRAILESGTVDAPQFFQPLDKAVAFNTLYGEAIGCPTTAPGGQLACMRALPMHKVLESLLDSFNPDWPFTDGRKLPPNTTLPALAPLMAWGPAIDGVSLLDVPLSLLEKGSFNKVPLIMGTNKDEGTIFIPAFPVIVPGMSFPPKQSDLPSVVQHAFDMYPVEQVANLTASLIAPMYTAEGYKNDTWAEGSAMLTHAFFACAARRALRAMASHGVPVWRYEFSQPLRFIEDDLLPLGNFHASELVFVWDNDCALLQCFNADEQAVANGFTSYWGNLAHNGDPNAVYGSLTVPIPWPRFNATAGQEVNIQMQVPWAVTEDLYGYYCDNWDEFYYGLQQGAAAAA